MGRGGRGDGEEEAREFEVLPARPRPTKSFRDRVARLLDELNQRPWRSESTTSALAFLELAATHSRPPEPLRPFQRALKDALSGRIGTKQKAAHLRTAASLLTRSSSARALAFVGGLLLREYAASLDATPGERMELIHLCQREMGLTPTPIDNAIPRLAPVSASGAGSKEIDAGLADLIEMQALALCESALHQVSAARPFAEWSMRDIDAALFAIRYHYVNVGKTLFGESGSAQQRQEDFRGLGQPLWEALRQAAEARVEREFGSKLLGDSDWHQSAQAAVFFSIGPAAGASQGEITAGGISAGVQRGGPRKVICRRPIAPSSDKHDKDEVERHRVLEQALPLAVMPARPQIEASLRRLQSEFPWAEDVLNTIFGELLGRAAVGAPVLNMPPTLLVGHPGSGKSRLARRLAEELGLPRLDLCLGGSSDSKMLGGTSRGWGASKPGDLATLLATHRAASAIVILDELDKAHDRQRDSVGIQAYLLGLLEPETAARHHDVFLKTECDFSGVLWLATANRLSGIAPALRSRFRVLMLRQPGAEHREVIARHAVADLASRWGVDRQVLPALHDLDLPLEQLASARQVRLATEEAVTHWARELQWH
ncbi:MAG: AAA family ATPase [Paucibacter sp.]|nr:AAA family ATPase [Roseateles sp.]